MTLSLPKSETVTGIGKARCLEPNFEFPAADRDFVIFINDNGSTLGAEWTVVSVEAELAT